MSPINNETQPEGEPDVNLWKRKSGRGFNLKTVSSVNEWCIGICTSYLQFLKYNNVLVKAEKCYSFKTRSFLAAVVLRIYKENRKRRPVIDTQQLFVFTLVLHVLEPETRSYRPTSPTIRQD